MAQSYECITHVVNGHWPAPCTSSQQIPSNLVSECRRRWEWMGDMWIGRRADWVWKKAGLVRSASAECKPPAQPWSTVMGPCRLVLTTLLVQVYLDLVAQHGLILKRFPEADTPLQGSADAMLVPLHPHVLNWLVELLSRTRSQRGYEGEQKEH